jgi:hypothetical protein
VVLLRALDDRADYLALADATLLLDTADGLKVISDERVNQLAAKERAAANQVPTRADSPPEPAHDQADAEGEPDRSKPAEVRKH